MNSPLSSIRQAADDYSAEAVGTAPEAKVYDVFIRHASEDKDEIVRPLARALTEAGVTTWYDETELHIGDSLRRKIDAGLSRCRFGVVVLPGAMMRTVELVVDAKALKPSGGTGTLAGPVHLRTDSGDFPSTDWIDFPLPVVAWFAEALSRLLADNRNRESVRFFDGPFVVELDPRPLGMWQLDLVQSGTVPQTLDSGLIEPGPRIASVRLAPDQLVYRCRLQGWAQKDSTRLDGLSSRLRDLTPDAN